MSKPPGPVPATALSPYLSLRQAVRPAIFAYSILAGDQKRAAGLAEECDNLVQASRELLKATGLVHIVAAEPDLRIPGHVSGDRQARLLDAYADAGLLWAKVVGSSLALAGTLLGRGQWDQVRSLASLLQDAGEDNAAAELRSQLGKVIWEKHYERLMTMGNGMSSSEIKKAISALRAALREIPESFPERNTRIERILMPLANSIYTIMEERGTVPDICEAWGVSQGETDYPDSVEDSLQRLSIEFETFCK